MRTTKIVLLALMLVLSPGGLAQELGLSLPSAPEPQRARVGQVLAYSFSIDEQQG